jgi:hypothetical protein
LSLHLFQTTSFLGQEKTKKTYSKPYSKKVNQFQDKTGHPNSQKVMTRLALILLTLLTLTSCTINDQTSEDFQARDTVKTDTKKRNIATSNRDASFKLDFFAAVPDTIDGCGEYFTYDTSKFEKNKYIFVSNLTEFAVIKINGKDFYLNRDTTESKEINDKSYIAVYKGQGYKAILKIKQTKTYDEGGFYSGTLQLIGGKINATFKVRGEAGC